jgi:hypothetical protein
MPESYQLTDVLSPLSSLSRDEAATAELFFNTVKPFYIPETDYHNFSEHIPEGLAEAMRLCDLAEAEGHKPNRFVVALAYIGHDPGFNHDLFSTFDSSKWETKEEYHAHITGSILRTMALEETTVHDVEKCIIGTNADAETTTIEEEIVSMADVSNVASPYDNYVLKSCKFFRETVLRGADIDLTIFKATSDVVLGKYFSRIKILKNLDKDEEGKSFVERGYGNMSRFRAETPQMIARHLGEQAVKFTDTLLRRVKN